MEVLVFMEIIIMIVVRPNIPYRGIPWSGMVQFGLSYIGTDVQVVTKGVSVFSHRASDCDIRKI